VSAFEQARGRDQPLQAVVAPTDFNAAALLTTQPLKGGRLLGQDMVQKYDQFVLQLLKQPLGGLELQNELVELGRDLCKWNCTGHESFAPS
jgi:hypothetical protein